MKKMWMAAALLAAIVMMPAPYALAGKGVSKGKHCCGGDGGDGGDGGTT